MKHVIFYKPMNDSLVPFLNKTINNFLGHNHLTVLKHSECYP